MNARQPFDMTRPELRQLSVSCGAFTALLACYYVLRPVRDGLAATLGADSIKYLSTAVFFVMLGIVPLFGWLVSRVPRPRLVPGVYGFFIVNLVVFALVFGRYTDSTFAANWARTFYVWVTVFNMFAVSVFWSRMAEIWSEPQGRRFFGVISAGGSLGGVIGPLLARTLSAHIAIGGLVWVSALLLTGSLVCLSALSRYSTDPVSKAAASEHEPTGGSMFEGLSLILRTPFLFGIAVLVCLGSLLGMIVYIEMARLVGSAFRSAAERSNFFASRDLWVNGGSFVLQLFVVGQVTRRLGVGLALILAGVIVLVSFVALGWDPTLPVLTAVSVALRCSEFGLAKPARDMLYTVVAPAAKYKSKNFIDTAVARGADMISGWMQSLVGLLGVTLAGWGWIAAGLTAALTMIAAAVGRGYRQRGGR